MKTWNQKLEWHCTNARYHHCSVAIQFWWMSETIAIKKPSQRLHNMEDVQVDWNLLLISTEEPTIGISVSCEWKKMHCEPGLCCWALLSKLKLTEEASDIADGMAQGGEIWPIKVPTFDLHIHLLTILSIPQQLSSITWWAEMDRRYPMLQQTNLHLSNECKIGIMRCVVNINTNTWKLGTVAMQDIEKDGV